MVTSKTKFISNRGAFSHFLKAGVALRRSLLNVESIIFWKLIREIEAAAICFVIERDPRKSQQNSRIRLRAQIKLAHLIQYEICLTHPNRGMSAW